MARILVIDDEDKICFAFEQFFHGKGHSTSIAPNAEMALEILGERCPEVIFLDIRLPGRSGLSILDEIKSACPEARVVVMTAYGTMDTAVEAMSKGVYEYLTKPIDLDRVDLLLKRMLRSEIVKPISRSGDIGAMAERESRTLIGKSQAIQDIYKMIGLLTTNDVPVLIEGESGVGKELVAQAIHFKSARSTHPFVPINCGAMPDDLLEMELFGHEKGAFTGAEARKIGKFEYAEEGTIFLDEIGDLKFPMQIKLLRALQEKQIVRIGGLEPIPVRARVIAATNKNLAGEVDAGNFRSDLYYRLQLITLNIPPLRERKEDIPELAEYFIHKANRELGKQINGIRESALDGLIGYDWPGNVRELENVIKRAAILTMGETLEIDRMDGFMSGCRPDNGCTEKASVEKTVRKWFRETGKSAFFQPGRIYKNLMETIEKTLIEECLKSCDYNQVRTSQVLGMNRTTLRKKMDEHGLKTGGVA